MHGFCRRDSNNRKESAQRENHTFCNVGFRMISSEIYSKRNLIANDLRQFRYHTVDGARFCRRHVNASGVKAMIYFSSPANPINRFYWTMNRLNSTAEAEFVVRHAGSE